MSEFVKSLESRSDRLSMMMNELSSLESILKSKKDYPYARLSGFLESILLSIAANDSESSEEVVRAVRYFRESIEKSEAANV
jgi:hypothetical protein